jgi:pimeloyl-ACP methyl ester carboxylesterase
MDQATGGAPKERERRRRFDPRDVRLVSRRRTTPMPNGYAQPSVRGRDAEGTEDSEDAPVSPYWLPPGRAVELGDRGATWIHELPAPRDAPAERPPLLLLHGWTATGALNWFPAYRSLARTHRVISIDHRGHGRGIASPARFRLEDCADDVVALADELGIDQIVPVGYSMGGPIAQLIWRRHRDRVAGLVLCATSRNFAGRPVERAMFSMIVPLSMAARVAPGAWQRQMTDRMLANRFEDDDGGRWAVGEKRRNDPRVIVEAGLAIGRFSSSEWVDGIDVPTAVVVTERDSLVPPHRQRRLAESITGATVHPVSGDHTVCVAAPERFVPALTDAVGSVTARIERRSQTTG